MQNSRYDQALVDIGLAFAVDRTDECLSKLRKLQDDCRKLAAAAECMQQKADERQHRLAFEEPHEQFPCMANALAIERSNEFGRHIVAKHDIDVGKVVLMEESFASVGRGDERMCHTCLAESKNFIACPHCVDVVFCDEKCMTANELHRFECHTVYHQMVHRMQFIIRTVLAAITAFPTVDGLMAFVEERVERKNLPESINDVQSKYGLYLQLEKFPLADNAIYDVYSLCRSALAIPSICKLFDSEEKRRFFMHLMFHHLAVNVNNGYENETCTSIGLVLCVFNHSCVPNLFNYAIDNRKFCVTVRPVKKGDQVK